MAQPTDDSDTFLNPPINFITVYEIELCEGGMEEGGWWYNWYSPTGIFLPVDENTDDLESVENKLREIAREKGYIFKEDMIDLGNGEKRRANSHRSVNPEVNATLVAETVQGDFIKNQERPHYE